ncbi:aspartate aminotransferase family protein [Streptomyces sp. NL15-2K]|uniref:aspartate aminotransferase family protein n=1 Tax=Streptomyces sp. NL15-2K TaxID=376149 RepID=UPI000F56ED31|nr:MULTISPECIES: aspartate aminotransferase family protein [Actinomycetes]WKX14168.1 aspartate aminotransferase family protein [Kutzneria buriramensis]GCB44677.1 adenosylmethionine-8-amino-7-oxononanoate aminotransferase [Streptomyces sp. NL15-2K]
MSSLADHVFHSWSAPVQPEIVSARGVHFTDRDGQRYLDLASQFVFTNLGHQHPKVVAAVIEQAQRLCTVAPPFENRTRSEAARLIAERAPGDLNRVFFTNGGADAVENAVRMAKIHTGRPKILGAYRSYHGNTSTAIQLTGDPRRWANEISAPGVVHFFGPFRYRSEFGAQTEAEECERALRHLESVVAMEGPHTIAAIVLETVPGTAGVLVPPDGYLAGVRALCDRHGILFVADEVMTGFGRTGEWLAVDRWNVTPDLITFAKGVNSGYVPLGGVIVSDRVAETFADRPFPGGLTYSGHPLACAAAVAALTAMAEEGVVEHARRLGAEVIGPGLRELAVRHPVIGEVRGLGVFWALELVRDRATREPLVPYNASGLAAAPMARIAAACRRRGLWPFIAMNRIHVAPPCTITDAEAKEALSLLDDVLAEASTW